MNSSLAGSQCAARSAAVNANGNEFAVRRESSAAFGWRRHAARQFADVSVATPHHSTKPATRGTTGVVDGIYAAYAMWHSPQPDRRSGVNV